MDAMCECKNICNQTTSKRCSCPCLVRGAYCTASCTCGTSKYECINRPGKGGELDFELQPLPEDEDDSDTDPDWMMVSYEDGQDFRVDIQDLNESLQTAVEKQYALMNIEEPIPDSCGATRDETTDPLSEVRDASRSELLEIIKLMVDHSPEVKQFLSVKNRPNISNSDLSESTPSESPNTALPGPEPTKQSAQIEGLTSKDVPASPRGPTPPPGPSSEIPSWCKCGRCQQMPTPLEQRCCRMRHGPCITHTAAEDLYATVLDQRMLIVCIRDRNEVFILNDDPDAHDCLRHMAYRHFILWRYGHLGALNRRVIPSCVVKKIRQKYPSHDNVYTGFIPSRLN